MLNSMHQISSAWPSRSQISHQIGSAAAGNERRIVRVYRPHRRERDALNARNQGFVLRFAGARILVPVLLNLLEEMVASGIRNKNGRRRR